MKNYGFILILFIFAFNIPSWGLCESSEEIFQAFGQEYEALKPPSSGSSVSSDYKVEQTALATYYSAKMLSLLIRQNQELLSKNNEMVQKYDAIIVQNEKIIQLLSIIAKNKETE